MKKVIVFVHLVLFVFFASLFAQEDAVITALREKYSDKSSFELTFNLEIFWKVREKREKKSGMLKIMPGDKFRLKLGSWEWVCDDHTYWQYNEKTSQVIIKNLLDINLSMHPSQMMKTYLSYSFKVRSSDEKEAVFIWIAADEEQAKSHSEITLWVDKKRNLIKKIVVVDKKGNESTYTFLKTKIGGKIPPETFTFQIPKGVEVVDTRD